MSTVVEPIINEVATNLDEAAAATRSLNVATISSFTVGVCTGVVMGFLWGYHYNKKKLYADAMKYAEEEIQSATSEMADHYRQKVLAVDDQTKAPVERIIQERGYVVEGDHEDSSVRRPTRPIPAPVPIITEETDTHNWDYTKENANRNPRFPYVIHKDEHDAFDAYENVSYAWYPLDEVLADEDGSRIENIAEIVGAENLERFGHGSGDPNVVFVRNNELRLQIEIVRVPDASYEESVVGLEIEEGTANVSNADPS